MTTGGPNSCPACGGSIFIPAQEGVRDWEYGAPGSWSYYACHGCGLWWIDPVPDAAVLANAYPADYHAYQVAENQLQRTLKSRYWAGKARRLAARAGHTAKVLDIGCAHGEFLTALRDAGLPDGEGIEYNPESAARARALGFTVHVGDFDTIDLPEGQFDCVTMHNVLEHVTDPLAVLRRCRRLLKPGGWVLGETPNHNCWDRRLFGRYWGGFHTPRHLVLFDRTTLAELGRKAGFQRVGVDNMIQPAHWAVSLQNWLTARLGLVPKGGRLPGYALLLMGVMPMNILQMLFSETTSVDFHFKFDSTT
jgi:SAM-dependent methyltransferase